MTIDSGLQNGDIPNLSSLLIFFLIFIYLFIYLVASGLSCGSPAP